MTIQIQLDDRIRLVASVLLLTKFVDENSGWKPHSLKVHTVEYLKAYEDHPCVTVSREMAELQWMAAFYCYAVLLDHVSGSFVLRQDAVATGYDGSYVKQFEEKGRVWDRCY